MHHAFFYISLTPLYCTATTSIVWAIRQETLIKFIIIIIIIIIIDYLSKNAIDLENSFFIIIIILLLLLLLLLIVLVRMQLTLKTVSSFFIRNELF